MIGATNATATAPAAISVRPALSRQRDEHGTDRQQRPLLVGDRQSQRQRRPVRAAALREQHRHDTERRAKQLLGVSDLQDLVGDRVGGAQRQRRGRRDDAAAGAAQIARQPDAEGADRQQAGQRREPIDQQRARAGEAPWQRERRPQQERRAVGGCGLQEGDDVTVQQRAEARCRLGPVVVEHDVPRPAPDHRQRCRDGEDDPQRGLAARRCPEHGQRIARSRGHTVDIGPAPTALEPHDGGCSGPGRVRRERPAHGREGAACAPRGASGAGARSGRTRRPRGRATLARQRPGTRPTGRRPRGVGARR